MARRRIILGLVVVLGAACSSTFTAWRRAPLRELSPEQREELFLISPDAPEQPDDEHCSGWVIPDGWPARVHEVVDSAALQRAVASRAGRWSARGYAVFHLAWDSLDAASEFEFIHGTLPDSITEQLGRLLGDHRRPRPQRPEDQRITRVRFRMDLAPDLGFRVGWPTACDPVVRNRDAVVEALSTAVEEAPPGAFREITDAGIPVDVHRRWAVVWVFVDEFGMPARREIQESSGHPVTDRIALQVSSLLHFVPARSNGRVVETWFAVPITMSRP